MVLEEKKVGRLVLRLIVTLVLIGWPRAGSALGTWSVISLPQQPSNVRSPTAVAVDTAGNLYVADDLDDGGRIQKQDAQGKWSVITVGGTVPGQFVYAINLAVDTKGNLYAAELLDAPIGGRILKRDPQGKWLEVDSSGLALSASYITALAVDAADNLYVVEAANGFGPWMSWLDKRDSQGNWTLLVEGGIGPGQIGLIHALAADRAGILYIADRFNGLQRRELSGNWTEIAPADSSQVYSPSALAVDPRGNLYVAEADGNGGSRIQKWNSQGNWSVIANDGPAVGQVSTPTSLAVDGAGNLYVADTGNNRVLKYTPEP